MKKPFLDQNLILRILFGLLYGLVVFCCTTPYFADFLRAQGIEISVSYLFPALMVFFSAVGLFECTRLMKMELRSWEYWAAYVLGGIVLYKYVFGYFRHTLTMHFGLSEVLAVSLIGVAVLTLFKYTQELYTESGKLIFSVIYSVLPFCFAMCIPIHSISQNTFTPEVFYIFVLIWCSDSLAYFCGRLFGKHKMAPIISPKKTWEGYFGGVICTILIGAVIEYFVKDIRGNWMVIGALIALFAPLGDLVESYLKRVFGVKDSGKILPGHGGILDRLDSFMICAPVIYLYFQIIRLV